MSVAAIVLAAGASTRLGQPKQNVSLGPETLLQRTVRIAHSAGLDPLFVVVAPGFETGSLSNASILTNEKAREGMASSIRVGIAAAIAARSSAAIILACDQPAVTVEHLRQLAAGRHHVVASAYVGRKGIPAFFPADKYNNLLSLRGDVGAREMLREAVSIALKEGELDVDTAEDLTRARELYANDPPL